MVQALRTRLLAPESRRVGEAHTTLVRLVIGSFGILAWASGGGGRCPSSLLHQGAP